MNPTDPPEPTHGPVIDTDPAVAYSLDVVASLCGISSRTVLHYHEQGLIHTPAGAIGSDACFDDAALLRLRRIEHLRTAYRMDIAAIKLTLGLLDEVESLRATLRAATKAG